MINIDQYEPDFTAIAAQHGAVSWTTERGYILEAMRNDWKFEKATELSLRNSLLNIAKTGISISPLEGLGYLQVRSTNIATEGASKPEWRQDAVFTTGYKGMIAGLVDCGAVKWMRGDVVRKGDYFEYHGPAAMPTIKVVDCFSKARAEILGCYALAALPDGQVLCEVLMLEDIEEIKKASKTKGGPWVKFLAEMMKKSAINRLGKTVPRKIGSRADAIFNAGMLDMDMDFSDNNASLTPEAQAANDDNPVVISELAPRMDKRDMGKLKKACLKSGRNFDRYLDWMGTEHAIIDGVLDLPKDKLPKLIAQLEKPRVSQDQTAQAAAR